MNLAYGLEDQEVTKEEYRLCGVITEIPTAWSDQYQNITVNMVVDGMEDKVIQCYRLAGEGADKLQVGDKITVQGKLELKGQETIYLLQGWESGDHIFGLFYHEETLCLES